MINYQKKKYNFYLKDLYFYSLIYLITFIILRIILPYADEPDYFHRYNKFFLNFNDFNLFQNHFNQSLTCNSRYLESSLFSIYSKISPYFCNNKLDDILVRVSYGLILNILYFTFIFGFFKNIKVLKFLKLNVENCDLNLHVFFCSLIYPTVIYYLGTRSNEIIIFYLGLLFFFTWKNYIFSYLLGFATILIDFGNGVIFFLFINYFYLFRFSVKFLSIRKVFIVAISLIILMIIFEGQIQAQVSSLLLQTDVTYFQNISRYVLDVEKNFVYPNYIKLIITYFSFIFLTPGFVKSFLLLIVMTIVIFYSVLIITGYLKGKNYYELIRSNYFKDNLINFYASVTFVIFVVLLFPTHSYIRYYIFIYPFVFSIFFLTLGSKRTFYLSIFAIIAVILEISFFRIIYYL